MKTIQEYLRSNNLSLDEVITVAQNRPLWRLMSAFDACHTKRRRDSLMFSVVTISQATGLKTGCFAPVRRLAEKVAYNVSKMTLNPTEMNSANVSGVFRMCERRGPKGSGDGSPTMGSRGKEVPRT